MGNCGQGIFKKFKLCNLIDEGKDIKRNELEKENVNKLDDSDIAQVNVLQDCAKTFIAEIYFAKST